MSVNFKGISIPDETSPTPSWILYHKLLRSKFGKDYAAMLFGETWARCGNLSLPDNADFDAYFTSQGINVKSGLDELITESRGLAESVLDFKNAIWWVVGLLGASLVIGVSTMLIRRPEAIASFVTPFKKAPLQRISVTHNTPQAIQAPKSVSVEAVPVEAIPVEAVPIGAGSMSNQLALR